MIGSLGDFVFTASREQFKTFKDLNLDRETRYGKHDVSDGKPRLEFTQEDTDSISFNLDWSIEDNVNPAAEISYLQDARIKGEVLTFLMGGKKVGSGRYVIKSIKERYKRIDNRGNALAIGFSLSLEEYVMDNNVSESTIAAATNVAKNPNYVGIAAGAALAGGVAAGLGVIGAGAVGAGIGVIRSRVASCRVRSICR